MLVMQLISLLPLLALSSAATTTEAADALGPFESRVSEALSSYLASVTIQPSFVSLYSEVVSYVGGSASISAIGASVSSLEVMLETKYAPSRIPSSVLSEFVVWETALPSSVKAAWAAYASSLGVAESSIVRGAAQAGFTTPMTTTVGPTTTVAGASVTSYNPANAAVTAGPVAWGVAAGIVAAAAVL